MVLFVEELPTETQYLPTTFKVALDFLTQRRD